MSEWKRVRLSEISVLITKGTTPTTLGYKFAERGVNFVKSESISFDGRIDTSKFAFIDEATHQGLSRSIMADKDILFSMAGVYLGKTAVVPKEILPANSNQAVGIIRLDQSKAEPRFVDYFIRNKSYNLFLNNLVSQSAQPNFNLTEIRNLPISLPPLPEQCAIAAVLGALDDKIELNRRMNETLEALAQSLFKSWFVDATQSALPKGWREESILSVAKLLSGGTPKTEREDYWSGNILWASAKDVSQCGQTFLVTTKRTITEKGLQESATQLIPAFCTVVVARGATTGRMTMFGREMAMNQTCYALASTTGTPFALYCLFRNAIDDLVQTAHGSVFDTITTSTFASSKVVLPPQEVFEKLEKAVAPLFGRILSNTQESRTLAALRDALLPKLLSGELRVPENLPASSVALPPHEKNSKK